MVAIPAAYVGCATQHGAPLTGTGSPNVSVNSMPAWTSDMPHACPTHGPEMVGMGSEVVLINGKRAARGNDGSFGTTGAHAGDFLQGAAPPDQILQGSPNVLIGTPGIGVASPANEALFCQLYCQLVHDWPTLTPSERKQRYSALLATMFGTFGAPPPGIGRLNQAGADASWNRAGWRVNIQPNAFTNPAGPPSGRGTLHEIRHAEQTWLAMRSNGGTGPADASPGARAAAAASPVNPNSPEGRMGSLHHDNEVGAGYQHWQDVITGVGTAATADPSLSTTPGSPWHSAVYGPNGYYNQPGGADAREVEEPGQCSGCP